MGWIIYPFLNFNGATVEVWEWMISFILHITGHVNTFLGLKLIHISKSVPPDQLSCGCFLFRELKNGQAFYVQKLLHMTSRKHTNTHTVLIPLLYHNETNWTKSYVSINSLRPIDAYMRQ